MIPVLIQRIQDQIDFAQEKWDRAEEAGKLWERQFWHGKLSGLMSAKIAILEADKPKLSSTDA